MRKLAQKSKRVAGLAVLAGATVLGASTPAFAGPLDGKPLTAEEVECSQDQLSEIMKRSWVQMPNDPGLTRPWGLSLSYIGESGQMVANAYMQQFNSIGPGNDDLPERHLWMTIDPEQTTFLNNPERPTLPKALIARDMNASSMVAQGDIGYLEFRLNPLLLDPDTTSPAALYDDQNQSVKVVNNLYDLAAGKSEAKPGVGRGLLDTLKPCPQFENGKIDEYDVHAMQLFTKTFTAQTVHGPRLPISQIIYRGPGNPADLAQGMREYWVDSYPRNPETFAFYTNGSGDYTMMRTKVTIQFDDKGRIVNLPNERARDALVLDASLPPPDLHMSAGVHRPPIIPTLVVNESTGNVAPIEGTTYGYSSALGNFRIGVGGAANSVEGIDWDDTLPDVMFKGKQIRHPWRSP